MLRQEEKELCRLFADILDYPRSPLPGAVKSCADLLGKVVPSVAGRVRSFGGFVQGQSLSQMEELYTQTFDISPASSLYLGYHLFGETPKRSEFLIRLTDAYQACSFSTGIELADHLGVVLRFLSVTEDSEFAAPLLEDCILPISARIKNDLKKSDNPYALVIEALSEFLRQLSRELAKMGGVPHV